MKNIILVFLGFIIFQGFSQTDEKLFELEKIGNAIDSTLFNNDASYTKNIYDLKHFSDRFLIESDDKDIIEFNHGFFKGFSKSFNFGNEILKQIKLGSEYTFLRTYKENGKYFLLFRLYGEGGLNYHKHLIKHINNTPKIVDTYVYLTGEYLSETIKFFYESSLKNKNLLIRFLKRKEIADLEKLATFRAYRDKRKYQEVIDLYENLSENSKKKKIFKIFVLTSAQFLSEDIYAKYIEDYKKEFPNDPSLYLISIDGYIIKKEFDTALSLVDKLDKAIGGDEFLDYHRGNIYYMKKDYVNAEIKMKSLTENFPNFLDAYDSLLTIYVEKQRVKEAISILEIMVEKFSLEKESLQKSVEENFAAFSKSEEFKNWLKS